MRRSRGVVESTGKCISRAATSPDLRRHGTIGLERLSIRAAWHGSHLEQMGSTWSSQRYAPGFGRPGPRFRHRRCLPLLRLEQPVCSRTPSPHSPRYAGRFWGLCDAETDQRCRQVSPTIRPLPPPLRFMIPAAQAGRRGEAAEVSEVSLRRNL